MTAISPCKHCGAEVPAYFPADREFEFVLAALRNKSRTLAAAEYRHFAKCSTEEAEAWVTHLLACARAWPLVEADLAVLLEVDQAFADAPKPEHFTNFEHCPECREHDDTLKAGSRESITRDALGNPGWDPICFCTPAGLAYYFPALTRFALLPDVWPNRDWYGELLLFHLAYDEEENPFLRFCSPARRRAVVALLRYLGDSRSPLVQDGGCETQLQVALRWWQAAAVEAAP